jgi:trans-AT polyketide synthase/acyltransferase/oxidoreductase domain-containing protein
LKNETSATMARPMTGLSWEGEKGAVSFQEDDLRAALLELGQPLWIIEDGGRTGLARGGKPAPAGKGPAIRGLVPPLTLESLGDPAFGRAYGTRYAYYTGAMANGIASENLVITMGKAGWLSAFGAGGLGPARVEAGIQKIKEALPNGPYAINLLNSPNDPAMEDRVIELYLVIEASAYLAMTVPLVLYRVAGLSQGSDGEVVIANRVIGKLSRLEMAQRFLEPAPADILATLLEQKKITPQQAELAKQVPMADDITVEADSGGHTDGRPLVAMFPAFLTLRDEMQQKHGYRQRVRVGAAGGIGTPAAALAAFMLGAAYVETGSINQACTESGTSEQAKTLLAQMDMADVAMAPSSDMFEMGVKVQVLKRGTMFAMRAQKLYELYTRYNAWEEVPPAERERLEKTVFKRDFASIWADTVKFFSERDPRQIERGNANPKDKMALVFRWYLGLSSRWAIAGEKGRELDYQVWAGPAQGAFNDWVKGTYLESPANRHVLDVAQHILRGCAYLYRVRQLEMLGASLPGCLGRYTPEGPLA